MNPLTRAAAVLSFACLTARAGEPPEWQAMLTPAVFGPQPKLAPCRLDYRVSWKGLLDAGSVRFEFGNPENTRPGTYVVTSASESLGAAAALYTYKHWFWSELDPASLWPKRFHSIEDVSGKRVLHTIDYHPANVHCSQTTRVLKNGFEYTRERDFAFAPVHDVFSAMLFVRSQDLTDGTRLGLLVQPGENPYLVRIRVDGHEPHDDRPAIRMNVTMLKIDPTSGRLLPYKKLKSATLWLSDDADRVPLEIRADVFIGDVRVDLVRMTKF